MSPADVPAACADITAKTGLPATDALIQGVSAVVDALMPYLTAREARRTL